MNEITTKLKQPKTQQNKNSQKHNKIKTAVITAISQRYHKQPKLQQNYKQPKTQQN